MRTMEEAVQRTKARFCEAFAGRVPSGKRPLSPVSVFLPRNHPSPKSSSRSISSTRSPRDKVSSSGLRAWNSSANTISRHYAAWTRLPWAASKDAEGRRQAHLRTTSSRSPGRENSVCERAAMGALEEWLQDCRARDAVDATITGGAGSWRC